MGAKTSPIVERKHCQALRVRSALQSVGVSDRSEYPTTGDSQDDLGIAVERAFVASRDEIDPKYAFFGELGLTGAVRPHTGVMRFADRLEADKVLVTSNDCATRASFVIGESRIVPVGTLNEALLVVRGDRSSRPVYVRETPRDHRYCASDATFSDSLVEYVADAVRSREPVMLVGRPGAGKTLLARIAHGALPDMSPAQALKTMMIHDDAGLLGGYKLVRPPFRAPHYTASPAAFFGCTAGRIGEIHLATHGVLFMDELLEFQTAIRERLVAEARRNSVALICAVNPCPGSCFRTQGAKCSCAKDLVKRYWNRAPSGMRRIDIPTPTA